MRKKLIEKLVKVVWIDPTSESGWLTEKELDEWGKKACNEKCISIGWIVRDEKNFIIISSDKNEAGEWGSNTLIYKSLIQSTKILSE